MIFRFLGTSSEITGIAELRQLGQSVDLPEPLAADIIRNCPILPVTVFDGCFTADDVRRFASPASRMDAPPEFQAKLKTALVALHELRERLKSGAGFAPITKETK